MPVAHPILFTLSARAELIEAQEWYENEASGLGRRLRTEVDAVLRHMTANPHQFPVVYKNIRRALFRRFPYALFFVMQADETLIVIACFHSSRNPAHWQTRT